MITNTPRKNRLRPLALLVGFVVFVRVSALSEPLERLISEEQAAMKIWPERKKEPPVAYLLGDSRGVLLYAFSVYGKQGGPLCEPLELDELTQMGSIRDKQGKIHLNTSLERVREMMGQSCLVRPGDTVLAVGEGIQRQVTITGFSVREEPPRCPNASPYSLWAEFDEKLDAPVLFMVFDPTIEQGVNSFRSGDLLKSGNPTDIEKSRLKSAVPFLNDYQVLKFPIGRANCDTLWALKRLRVSPEDEGLWNEGVWWEWDEQIRELISEKVSLKDGSGHLSLLGTLEFNGDGYRDLLVEADRHGCRYRVLFAGRKKGFEAIALPHRRCTCD